MPNTNEPIDHLGYTTDKGFPHTSASGTNLNINEDIMPEVIYANNKPSSPNTRVCWIRIMEDTTSYTRTDKVEELKEALRECQEALKFTKRIAVLQDENEARMLWSNWEDFKQQRNAALTKTSTLLQ